jgi:hypothetical protein
MRRLVAAWHRHWFAPASLVDLGVARAVVAGIFLALDPRTRYLRVALVPAAFWRPLAVVAALPQPDLATLRLMGHATAALLVAVLVGVWTRVALVAVLPLLFVQEAWLNSAGKIVHGTLPAVWALVFLVLSPCDRRFALGPAWRRWRTGTPPPATSRYARWAVELAFVEVAGFYALAGVSKLRTAGLGWADGWTLQYFLLLMGTPAGLALAASPALCAVLSKLVLAFELGAPLGIARPLRPFVLAGGVAFHLGTTIAMRIVFWPVVALYLVFVPWERLARRVGRVARVAPAPALW